MALNSFTDGENVTSGHLTFVADAAVVVGPLTVLLEVVRHVGGPQEFATHLAGDLVLVAGQV
jgi:hypothetical protein